MMMTCQAACGAGRQGCARASGEHAGTESVLLCCAALCCGAQQPIGDFDAQRKRLGQIRDNLTGWRALGCELIECYQ